MKKPSSNQPCGRDSEYIIGAFLKSFSIFTIYTYSSSPAWFVIKSDKIQWENGECI